MKRTKALITLLIAAVILTGCDNSQEPFNSPESSFEQSNQSSVMVSEDISTISENNSSDSSLPEDNSAVKVKEEHLTEAEQILKLLKDYAMFDLDMKPTIDNYSDFMDKTQKITIDKTSNVDGHSYTEDYYKTVNLPANTISELNDKLDGFVTENLKNEFLNITNNMLYTIAENGDLYMLSYGYLRGGPILNCSDFLFLDSLEHPDDDTIILNVTSFGDKDIWKTPEDIVEKASVKFVKTNDGWRIDEWDNFMVINFFQYYDEIIYGDISLSLH